MPNVRFKAKVRTPEGDLVDATRRFELQDEEQADADAVPAPPTSS